MLFYLNPASNLEINSFKRIDFSTNQMGSNHFSLFSSILKPRLVTIVSSMSKLCSSYFPWNKAYV